MWTLQKRGAPLPSASVPFDRARPTYTHQALLALQRAGKLSYLVSCNVDCLHQRSGFPRAQLAELHGNCFAERCERCSCEAVRDFEQTTVGFKKTGRVCTLCGGAMRDQVLDWDDALPVAELEEAERQSSAAQLTITLGTSLQIHPACDLPLRTLKAGGALVIVNLQRTPKDSKATLVIRRRADDVMRALLAALQLPVPRFIRRDALIVRHDTGNASARGGTAFTLHVRSRHAPSCPVPWLAGVDVCFPDSDTVVLITSSSAGTKRRREGTPIPEDMNVAVQPAAPAADAGTVRDVSKDGRAWTAMQGARAPWRLRCKATPAADSSSLRESVRVCLRLRFAEGCTSAGAELAYVASFARDAAAERLFDDIETVSVSYD